MKQKTDNAETIVYVPLLIEKYKIVLPMTNQKEFNDVEQKLIENEDFRKDMVRKLKIII